MKYIVPIIIILILATGAVAAPKKIKEPVQPAPEPIQDNEWLIMDPPTEDPVSIHSTIDPTKAPAAACVDGQAPVAGCDITGDITFPSGTYDLPSGMTVSADNIVIDCSGATYNGDAAYRVFTLSGRNNVEIRNCNMNNYTLGILVQNSYNVTLENNGFSHMADSGIVHDGSCNVHVDGNSFNNIEKRAGRLTHSGTAITYPITVCDYMLIFSNNTVNYGTRGWWIPLIPTGYDRFPIEIIDNDFDNIWFTINMYSAADFKYLYNVVTESSGVIMQAGSHNIEIAYNNFTSTGWGDYATGVNDGDPFQFAENISIHDNRMDMAYVGHYMRTNYGDVEFYQNYITNSARGIAAYNTTGLHMHSNTITGNDVGAQITPASSENTFYLNNIYNNGAVNIDTMSSCPAVPWEMGFAGKGNYWGHSSPPCFQVDADAWGGSASLLTDPYAQCSPNSGRDITIPLEDQYRWYFFSYNVNPSSSDPADIFGPAASLVQFAKSFVNSIPLIWFFNDPFGSTLENMNFKHGYWFKTTDTGDAVVVTGSAADPCQTLSLNTGIHWISYYGQVEKPVAEALSSIDGDYEWVRTFVDEVPYTYDPALPSLSDLETLKPGRAYRIKMTQPGILDYCS